MKYNALKVKSKNFYAMVYTWEVPPTLLFKHQRQHKSPTALNENKAHNPQSTLKNCHTSGSAPSLAN